MVADGRIPHFWCSMPLEIDLSNEKTYLLSDLSKVLKREGATTGHSYQTLYRYVTKGVENRMGARIFMARVWTPSGYTSSREAYYRFLEDLNIE